MATETLHHEVDDVPLLGQDEKPQLTEQRSTSPALAAGVAYPAQPQQPYSGPPIGGGGAGFSSTPAQYNPYPAAPSGQQQSSNTNVNVVTAQPPSLPSAPNPKPIEPPNPTLMIVTIIAALMLFFFGMLPVWLCIFPAVVFAIVGFNLADSPKEDQRQIAKMMNWIAFGCNIGALVTFIICILIMIICIIVFAVSVHNY